MYPNKLDSAPNNDYQLDEEKAIWLILVYNRIFITSPIDYKEGVC